LEQVLRRVIAVLKVIFAPLEKCLLIGMTANYFVGYNKTGIQRVAMSVDSNEIYQRKRKEEIFHWILCLYVKDEKMPG